MITNVQTVFVGAILVVIVLLIVLTWTKYPHGRYIVVSRADGDATKYIGISSIEVFDNYGARKEIVAVEGKSIANTAYSSTASATANNTLATLDTGDVALNGKNAGYVRDAVGSAVVGPVIAFLRSTYATSGYLIFTLGCTSHIAKITIKSPEDDTSRVNLQRVKVYLLDKDKNPIKGAEQIIPYGDTIPQSIHNIMFT